MGGTVDLVLVDGDACKTRVRECNQRMTRLCRRQDMCMCAAEPVLKLHSTLVQMVRLEAITCIQTLVCSVGTRETGLVLTCHMGPADRGNGAHGATHTAAAVQHLHACTTQHGTAQLVEDKHIHFLCTQTEQLAQGSTAFIVHYASAVRACALLSDCCLSAKEAKTVALLQTRMPNHSLPAHLRSVPGLSPSSTATRAS